MQMIVHIAGSVLLISSQLGQGYVLFVTFC